MSDTEKTEPISLEELDEIAREWRYSSEPPCFLPVVYARIEAAARAYHELKAENEWLYSEGGREWLLKTIAQDTEITALRTAVAQLREALAPFAKMAENIEPDLPDNGWDEYNIANGKLRPALAILISTSHLVEKAREET